MDPFNWTQIVSGLFSVLGVGGGISAYLAYRKHKLDYQKQKLEQESIDFGAIIKTWQEDNHRLREIEEKNRVLIIQLKEEIIRLKSKVVLLQTYMESSGVKIDKQKLKSLSDAV